MTDEPYTQYGQIIYESGVPLRVNDSGGQGDWVRVPNPTAGDIADVLTVQPDLSVAWDPPASSGGGLQVASVAVSNAELKAATSKTMVTAQGAGTVIIPIRVGIVMHYGGTNAFTNNAGINFRWGTSDCMSVFGAGTNTFSTCFFDAGTVSTAALSAAENADLTAKPGNAYTGNAAGNNTATFYALYYVLTL